MGRLTRNAIRRRRVHAAGLINSDPTRVRVDHDIANYLTRLIILASSTPPNSIVTPKFSLQCRVAEIFYREINNQMLHSIIREDKSFVTYLCIE